MALPSWPAINSVPLAEGFKLTPWAAGAIVTEFEGGNARNRRRPGDSVTFIAQIVRLTLVELEVFKTWFGSTLGGGRGRFTMNVWTGSAYESKVCQFNLKTPLDYRYVSHEVTDVVMNLRVYGA